MAFGWNAPLKMSVFALKKKNLLQLYVFKDLRSQPVSAAMHHVSCTILKIFMIIY